MTHEEKQEKLHLIQLDWSSHGDTWKIEYFEKLSGRDEFNSLMWEYIQEDLAGFRRYLEDNYNLEQKYIDERWEE